jgi:hypothetical protein
MKRLPAIAAMTVLGVALTAPAAMADDATTTAAPTDSGTVLEKISAYVRPSVVYSPPARRVASGDRRANRGWSMDQRAIAGSEAAYEGERPTPGGAS